jgi:ABC-type ATPase with predicted acetyltransferase domain
MPTFDILKEVNPEKTFRVEAVKAMFDIQTDRITEKFTGNLDIENRDWNVGVIVGASGTGKSTIVQEVFEKEYIRAFDYKSKSILDDMPEEQDIKTITRIFNSVGFSSPPSWLKPYGVLSTGEKMRVDLARCVLENRDLIVFDEFTSTINREVAKIGSFALQKAVRKMGKKFIAVSCHDDILEWLEPDWVFNTNDFSFFLTGANGSDQRLNSKFINAQGITGDFLKSITI